MCAGILYGAMGLCSLITRENFGRTVAPDQEHIICLAFAFRTHPW